MSERQHPSSKQAIEFKRWQDLWRRMGGRSDPAAHFATLQRRYAEPQRAYHTLEHISDCLAQFDYVSPQAICPDEVELALWLHDVIYDPQAADNEERSARWAVDLLQEGGVSAACMAWVGELILATRHTGAPDEPDARLVADIDLSILGRSPEVFAVYEDRIRVEYQWVAEDIYRRERARILETFLARVSIYQTPFFKERYEVQARENLKQLLRKLRGVNNY